MGPGSSPGRRPLQSECNQLQGEEPLQNKRVQGLSPCPPEALLIPGDAVSRLRLIRTDSIGPVTYRQLMARFGNAGAALAEADVPLFEALRAWRADLAREQGVPAYVILHDKTLRELAARRPASQADLLDVPGIGQAKVDRYGETLLQLLA